jgi:hypothetical protein
MAMFGAFMVAIKYMQAARRSSGAIMN